MTKGEFLKLKIGDKIVYVRSDGTREPVTVKKLYSFNSCFGKQFRILAVDKEVRNCDANIATFDVSANA